MSFVWRSWLSQKFTIRLTSFLIIWSKIINIVPSRICSLYLFAVPHCLDTVWYRFRNSEVTFSTCHLTYGIKLFRSLNCVMLLMGVLGVMFASKIISFHIGLWSHSLFWTKLWLDILIEYRPILLFVFKHKLKSF